MRFEILKINISEYIRFSLNVYVCGICVMRQYWMRLEMYEYSFGLLIN